MIGYLKGELVIKDPTYVILDVHGVGYEVKISLHTFSKIKDLSRCLLFTHFHVKEDAQTLYGFIDQQEKEIFLRLISINGVGPNTAMMINSSLSVDELKHAIVNGEVAAIQRVKGIGNKTAQRIILELKDKISLGDMGEVNKTGIGSIRNEALSALTTLGINKAIALKNIDSILQKHGGDITLEALIKMVLKQA